MATNPNNCEGCRHYQLRDPKSDGHCYMFAEVPTERCYQHTYPQEQHVELEGVLYRLFQRVTPKPSDR